MSKIPHMFAGFKNIYLKLNMEDEYLDNARSSWQNLFYSECSTILVHPARTIIV